MTNSEAIAEEATKDTDMPVFPLKEKVYPAILGSNKPLTEAEYKAKIWERHLWLYMVNDDSWEWEDYFEAVRAMINDSVVDLRRYGISGYNIDFVSDYDREFYFARRGGEKIQGNLDFP